jgi:hypothetical protein
MSGILEPAFDWSNYTGSKTTLLLYVDGEYMDIYMGDTDHKFGTVVRVKEEFIVQYESLMETNTCDLANVIWPRRADGSMDYPPPDGVQLADITEQPETVAADTAAIEYEDTAAVTPERETVAQQPGTALPLIVVLAAAVVLVAAGVAVFLLRRKK